MRQDEKIPQNFVVIYGVKESSQVKNRRLRVRISEMEQAFLEKRAMKKGYNSVSDYVRDCVFL